MHKLRLLAPAIGLASLLSFQTHAQGLSNDAEHEPDYTSNYDEYVFELRKKTKECSLARRFNQKYLYIYEPKGTTQTWSLKVRESAAYIQFDIHFGGGGQDSRPKDKRRACRGSEEHGGLVGAFIPAP